MDTPKRESPLGIMPDYIWKARRAQALTYAIERYVSAARFENANRTILLWCHELQILVRELEGGTLAAAPEATGTTGGTGATGVLGDTGTICPVCEQRWWGNPNWFWDPEHVYTDVCPKCRKEEAAQEAVAVEPVGYQGNLNLAKGTLIFFKVQADPPECAVPAKVDDDSFEGLQPPTVRNITLQRRYRGQGSTFLGKIVATTEEMYLEDPAHRRANDRRQP